VPTAKESFEATMAAASLVLREGRIVDPAAGLDAAGDLVVRDGRVAEVGLRGAAADETFDARGLLVVPGLVDVHVHLREPGKEAAETVASGCAAALAGGFTTVVCMPNTTPPLDAPERIAHVKRLAAEARGARVEVAACLTVGRAGERLVEIGRLGEAGAVAFTDDGSGVADPMLMWEALKLADLCGLPVLDHAEDPVLSGGGVINEGDVSEALGLPGMPAESEAVMVARDLALAKVTGARLHIQHVSTAAAVALIRAAKRRGVRVTAEACPHHFALTEEACLGGDAVFKMNPPLRRAEDAAAVRAGLADGTLDCIAPHTAEEKARGLAEAPCGVIGLETTVAVVWRELVEPGVLTVSQAVERLATNPARVIGGDRGTLRVGAPADVTLIDPERPWTIEPERFRSKSRNCPFAGWKVNARVVAVVRGGRLLRVPEEVS